MPLESYTTMQFRSTSFAKNDFSVMTCIAVYTFFILTKIITCESNHSISNFRPDANLETEQFDIVILLNAVSEALSLLD